MKQLDPTDPAVWQQVRATVRGASASSMHCAIASIGADGHPHVTPIGSVMLTEPGRGVYLDVINVQLSRNIDRDPRIELLAVDSRRRTWLRGLVRGRFDTPPGVRLVGVAGATRPLRDDERERFERRVRWAIRTRGGRRLWGDPSRFRARDLTFTDVSPVRIPAMTEHLWADASATPQASRYIGNTSLTMPSTAITSNNTPETTPTT